MIFFFILIMVCCAYSQDIDIASIEPTQSFLSLYIGYYIIEEGYHRKCGWGDMMMHLQACFMVQTGIQIHVPTLHEMCRETLNPHIGTVTSNSNLQIVFALSLFHDIDFTSWLFWRTIR